ncbi:hypothetical protein GH714_012204 [Hevea brasiliensis]|uniref:Disease resistance protein At4g27190-like leucine-rich repeats domain-containing protein n=1 Tax=Hevea brasiliensis TaxID=3981 RepID=A0A6A6L2C5_HEVBR|nr:hypothetical protein GH714_012204 [Hevea brasiliensis]
MLVWSCPNMEAIVIDEDRDSNEEVVEFNQLRSLTLVKLPHLRSFRSKMKKAPPGTESRRKQILTADETAFEEFVSEESSLFNRMVAFSNLENLHLRQMNDMKSIWHSQFATDSFCKLKSLTISDCSKLRTVFPSNFLERFQRLEELKVYDCISLQEIYQLEGSNVIEAFELRKLSIQSLPSLKHVWRKDPQGIFTFQNLKSVEVSNCDVLKNLFPASIAESLLQLENLTIRECGVEEIVAKPEDVEPAPYYCFKFPQLTSLKLIELSELRSFYPGTHISEWQKLKSLNVRNCRKVWDEDSRLKPVLQHLETLSVKCCNSLTNMVPSSSSFPNLATLEVSFCDGLVNLITVSTAKTMVQLTKMTMTYFQASKFPELWHGGNQGRLFHNVQSLTVDQCAISDIPVPANLLQFLNKLEKLQVEYCDSAEIVFDLEGLFVDDGHTELLPQLRSSNLECLSLKKLSIYECPSMKNVFGTLLRLHRPNTNDEGREQRLDNEGFDTLLTTPFCHKMFPNLEELSLDKKSAITILQSQFPTDFFSQVKVLQLRCFPNKSLVPLFSLLPGFPNLQNLVVLHSSLKQLFPFEGFVGDQEDTTAFPRIRALKLKNLDDLKHVWESDCQLHNPLFQSLKNLEIESCGNLIFLVPSSASFRNLKALKVAFEWIDEVQLSNFPMLKEKWHAQFPFENLKYLRKDFLKCPSLKRIDMVGCPNMELLASKFCEEQDLSMIAEGNEAGIHNGDFVFSIAASSGGKVSIPSLEELRVEYNTMKDMWSQADFLSGLKGIELTCFSNDSTLLPSYFFQSLPDLEKLVLSDASFEEIIFMKRLLARKHVLDL